MHDGLGRCDFHALDRGLLVGAAFPCDAAPCVASVYGVRAVGTCAARLATTPLCWNATASTFCTFQRLA